MVCLGNICRSPLAEGILRNKIKNHNVNVLVDSSGTASYHVGNPPDRRSIEIAKKHHIDISKQVCRAFCVKDFEKFDKIYAMDTSNVKDLVQLAQNQEQKDKIHLILEAVNPNSGDEVPDPYYGGEEGFEEVYQMLDKACEAIVKSL